MSKMQKVGKLANILKTPANMRVHIGAHKTATTHFQDTLAACNEELKRMNSYYITRDDFRHKHNILDQDQLFSASWHKGLEKRYTLSSKLFTCKDSRSNLLISEENILGGVLEAFSSTPYQQPRLNFLRYASKLTKVSIFLCVRSFSDVLPGAYVTSLRFRPVEAMARKENVIRDLDSGNLPSWLLLIKDLESALSSCEMNYWTYEDYVENKEKILNSFVGFKLTNIPEVPKPKETATPTKEAINEIEHLIRKRNFVKPSNWLNICGDIYSKYPVSKDNPKYNFISENLRDRLDSLYLEEKAILTTRDAYLG